MAGPTRSPSPTSDAVPILRSDRSVAGRSPATRRTPPTRRNHMAVIGIVTTDTTAAPPTVRQSLALLVPARLVVISHRGTLPAKGHACVPLRQLWVSLRAPSRRVRLSVSRRAASGRGASDHRGRACRSPRRWLVPPPRVPGLDDPARSPARRPSRGGSTPGTVGRRRARTARRWPRNGARRRRAPPPPTPRRPDPGRWAVHPAEPPGERAGMG